MENLTPTATMLKSIIAEKGYTLHEIYRRLGNRRTIYAAFQNNRFTIKLLLRVGEIIGEDLTMFANCNIPKDVKEMRSGKKDECSTRTRSKKSNKS